ncbi:c-type cytochrome [Mangrovimicrobium sediminis]|uniref:c-type cytochrome n=1 Tax=Mangrovimicrobium sediminis TaxID=2562682 RepID=UPI001436C36F|nr:c-type cytochrome [Haliea sp. SAOS-164]
MAGALLLHTFKHHGGEERLLNLVIGHIARQLAVGRYIHKRPPMKNVQAFASHEKRAIALFGKRAAKAATLLASIFMLASCKLIMVPGTNGTVVSASGTRDCPATSCVFDASEGLEETFTAIPNAGYVFSNWTGWGACEETPSATCDVVLRPLPEQLQAFERDIELTAHFVEATEPDPEILELYSATCSVCHDTGVAGSPRLGVYSDWEARIAKGIEVLYANTINGFNAMPPMGLCLTCTDQQLKDLVDYMVLEALENAERQVNAP